jgi:hypothetical protein
MACFPAVMTGQTTKFKFVQDGEFAQVSQSTALSNFTLQVSRGFMSGSGATASLQYNVFSIAADFSSITFINEFGPIPPSAFTGQNTQNLALSIDTSALDPSSFQTESCTLDLTSFILTCGPGPVGVISLQFTENDAQSTRILASNVEVTNGPVTTRTHQKSDQSTATVQGSIYGTTVAPSVSAVVGVSHMSSIQIDHQ